MKKLLSGIVVSAIVLTMLGCNKAEEPAAPAAGGAGAPAANAAADNKGQGRAQEAPPVMLGPGAAGADARVGGKAGGK